jgi:hypothetical protein
MPAASEHHGHAPQHELPPGHPHRVLAAENRAKAFGDPIAWLNLAFEQFAASALCTGMAP